MPKKIGKNGRIIEPKILYRDELVALIQEKNPNLAKKDVENIVKLLPEIISEQLAAGNNIVISRFGSFKKIDRAARTGRNPINGEEIQIPAQKGIRFGVSETLKRKINEK